MSERVKKVNEFIREKVSESLNALIDNPEIGLFTVTDVESTPDLKHADVWISFISEDHRRSLELVDTLRRDVQQDLSHTLVMKYVPRIRFRLDESQKHVERITELLGKQKNV